MNLFGPDLYARFPYRSAVYLGLLIALAFVWAGSSQRRRLRHALGGAAHRDPGIDRRPVARIIAVIVIVITRLSLAFGESSGGFRRLIQIVFGLSIAFAATSFFLSFFSFGGGAVIA